MRPEDDILYIALILEHIADIERYVQASKERFMRDDMVRNVTLHQLQVMAESTQRLSESVKQKQSHIPWQQIADFRNVLVHDYDGRINFDIVWASIEKDLPLLKAAVEHIKQDMNDAK